MGKFASTMRNIIQVFIAILLAEMIYSYYKLGVKIVQLDITMNRLNTVLELLGRRFGIR